MTEKPNPYKQAIELLHHFATSKVDEKGVGGVEAQEDQIIGLANQVFMSLASECQDSTLNGLTYLLRKARGK